MSQEYGMLLFGVQRSVRYHMRRRRFFDGITRVTNAASLIFGSSALFVLLFHEMPSEHFSWAPLIPAIVGAVSIVALVYESPRMARVHSELARKFIELEQRMVLEPDADGDTLKQFRAQKLVIEVDEPPIHRILDALCRNELIRAYGYDKRMYPATRFERLTAQILYLEPNDSWESCQKSNASDKPEKVNN
ncbi:MAG: hypothetical protein OXP66_08900 [Candidatus Tectomicrobia bacterium]|nr:hypothetical protein [Candidatus Tectomicrobia bacterium]